MNDNKLRGISKMIISELTNFILEIAKNENIEYSQLEELLNYKIIIEKKKP